MKTKTTKTLFGFVLAGLVFGSSAYSAPLNLLAFKGSYRGTTTVTGPNPTQTGPASLTFAVVPQGTSGRVSYKVTLENVQVTSFALAANKRVSVSDLLVGIAGANNAKRGRGPWSQAQRTLRFSANNGEGTSLRGTAVVKDLANRRQLTLTLVTSDGVDATTFKSVLRSPLP